MTVKTVLTWLKITDTSSHPGEKPSAVSLHHQHFMAENTQLCFYLVNDAFMSLFKRVLVGCLELRGCRICLKPMEEHVRQEFLWF